jgi:hypothetical protein
MARILTILIIAAFLVACSGEPDTREPGPYFGSNLSLSGDLHTREINFDFENIDVMSLLNLLANPSDLITYPEADKNLDLGISDGSIGGSGKVKNGKFSYSVGKPSASALQPIEANDIPEISAIYKNVTITPQDANAAFLYLSTNSPDYPLLTRENTVPESELSSMSFKITAETTSYVYVDKNITITAEGSTYTDTITNLPIANNMDIPVKLTTHDINLSLKPGWNAIHSIFAVTIKTLTIIPSFTFEADGDVSFSVGIPSSHKWVLNSYNNDFIPFP